MRPRAASLLLAVMISGCREVPSTEIVARIVSDMPASEMAGVKLILERADGFELFQSPCTCLAATPDCKALPLTFGAVRKGSSDEPFRVRALGFQNPNCAGDPLVQQAATVKFEKERRLLLDLSLLRVCKNVPCGRGMTCKAGACADDKAGALPEFNPDALSEPFDLVGPATDGPALDLAAPDAAVDGAPDDLGPDLAAPDLAADSAVPDLPPGPDLAGNSDGGAADASGDLLAAKADLASSPDLGGIPNLPLFGAAPVLAAGTQPRAVTVADLNKDGKADIVIGNHLSDDVSVILSQGKGAFAPPVAYGGLNNPVSIEVLDLNGDNAVDLILANAGVGSVSVLLGKGDGTFGKAINTPNGAAAALSLATGDLDGDGKTDVVTASGTSWSVNKGMGDGSFGAPTLVVASYKQVRLTDLDGDGKLDLLAVYSNGVGLLIGNGNGTFGASKQVVSYSGPIIALADVSGDGKSDLFVIGNGDNVSVYVYNVGLKTYGAAVPYPLGRLPTALALADLNGDAQVDVVSNDQTSASATVLLQKGNGAFATSQSHQLGFAAVAVAVGDLDGDKNIDVVTVGDNGVSVLYGPGDGTLRAPRLFLTLNPNSAEAGDLNGDGKPDVALVSGAGDKVVSLLGDGAGLLAAPVISPSTNLPSHAYLADVNGDQRSDLFVVHSSNSLAGLFLAKADGSFDVEKTFATAAAPLSLAIGDFDGKGGIDFIAFASSDPTAHVYLGDGGGQFTLVMPPLGIIRQAPAAVAGDFNNDKKTDFIVTNTSFNTPSLHLHLGNGDGTFQAPKAVTVGANVYVKTLMAHDFDHDGNLDLLAGNGPGGVLLLQGKGDGTFTTLAVGKGANAINNIAIADLNGDGIEDIVWPNYAADRIEILLGKGSLAFHGPITLPIPNPVWVSTADFDKNGKRDLLISVDLVGVALLKNATP
ncbi:MAG: VCBS repeat-containing protein [Myxococcales bacterium]|nr:VCBS repeat-containing protein [Myxococcales bacterium]